MSALSAKIDHIRDDLRVRDEIIHALYLKLRSERETSEAVLEAARLGAAPEVLEAIASDPVPVVDDCETGPLVEALVERSRERRVKTMASGR